ncbi:MAG: ribosomal protein S18-alanine N-acetyltransferase [Dehalococcoidia bacterium]
MTRPERLRLRRMTATDLPAVREVEARAYGTGFAPGALEHELESNSVARYVLLERRLAPGSPWQVAGVAGLWLQFDQAHVVTCAVDPIHQRRGFGGLLVHALLGLAEANGMEDATLEVRVSNIPARALYRRYGFWEVGERRRYYADNGEDAVIMTTEAFASAPFQALQAQRAGELEALGLGWPGLVEAFLSGENPRSVAGREA